jgi:hypothetical protein
VPRSSNLQLQGSAEQLRRSVSSSIRSSALPEPRRLGHMDTLVDRHNAVSSI